MIAIETLELAGISSALHAMRNPYDSWSRSDSSVSDGLYTVGAADHDLSKRLADAGTEHCKHLRMIVVYADITAPLYWWKEFDTYRAGVEKLSCSTMHTITNKEFELADFSVEHMTIGNREGFKGIINCLNTARANYRETKDKKWWWQIIQTLPTSYNQKRTVMMSYAALRQICKQRKGHKLDEWHSFIDWCKTLPENWMIIDPETDNKHGFRLQKEGNS